MDDDFECPESLDSGNPWKRRFENYHAENERPLFYVNSRKQKFYKLDLQLNTKRAVLKVSPSVVGLASSSGGKEVFWGSGVIFESLWKNDSFSSLVVTSATLLRPPCSDVYDNRPMHKRSFSNRFVDRPEDEGYITIDEKINVYVVGMGPIEGSVVASDFHHNIAILKLKTDNQLPRAVLRPLDVSFDNMPPRNFKGCTRNFDSRLRLIPGDDVIAVGRYTESPYEVMTAPGRYSSKDVDKIEHLRANCLITKCGIGGPLISCEGEVIGINYYSEDHTPFLPINIFSLWWSCYNDTRSSRRPWMGMEVANLHYKRDLEVFQRVMKLGIFQGVRVRKVLPGSPAELSDLRD